MRKNLYAIYDKKANSYGEFQWQDINDECAVRTISEMVNSLVKNKLNQNPDNFELYKLAIIDLETGEITPAREFVKNLVEVKKPEDESKKEILNKLAELYNAVMGVKN